jgi:hypothetical protein
MRDRNGRRSRVDLLVTIVCGLALLIGAGCVGVAVFTPTHTVPPVTSPASAPTACVSDPERPDGANGCEQDPMVVCMADHSTANETTDPDAKRALADEAAAYCVDAVNDVCR